MNFVTMHLMYSINKSSILEMIYACIMLTYSINVALLKVWYVWSLFILSTFMHVFLLICDVNES